LCFGCHEKFHHRFGRSENTRSQFDEFMRDSTNAFQDK
jgi:hypothetical protein